ncbi:MAG: MFS transporter, partial [Pirellulaceae bacterium]|nr:MFS transporter [Pirellulaceae bacterium]
MNEPEPLRPTVLPAAVPVRSMVPLLVLFGSLYFVQGTIEPTACLPMQPIQSQLRGWGLSVGQVGHFFGIIAIAWSIKPLFGLVSDLVPIFGQRRRPYLILSIALTAATFFAVAALWGKAPTGTGWLEGSFRYLADLNSDQPAIGRIGWLLLVAGIGIATTDVVIDALGVETGQPLRITGQIQAVQWGALSVAGLIAGSLGGLIATHHWQRPMFLGCGCLALMSLGVVLVIVPEPRRESAQRPANPLANLRSAWRELLAGRKIAVLLAVAAFMFLWNFNPFSSSVMQDYLTKELHFSELFYGHLISIQAAAQAVACLAYFWLCRRVPLGWLVHGCIAGGVVCTLAFWIVRDPPTAIVA